MFENQASFLALSCFALYLLHNRHSNVLDVVSAKVEVFGKGVPTSLVAAVVIVALH